MADVDTVMVYDFEYLDREARVWVRSPVPGTLEAISANGWRTVPNTARPFPRQGIASNGVAYHATPRKTPAD
jgi:hypothetical protein